MELLPCWVRLWALGLERVLPAFLPVRASSASQEMGVYYACHSWRHWEAMHTAAVWGGCFVHFLWSFQFDEEAESVKVWCNFPKTEQLQWLELGLDIFYPSELPAHIVHLLNTRISFSSWKPPPFSLCSLGEADPVGLWLRPVQWEFCLSEPQWLAWDLGCWNFLLGLSWPWIRLASVCFQASLD